MILPPDEIVKAVSEVLQKLDTMTARPINLDYNINYLRQHQEKFVKELEAFDETVEAIANLLNAIRDHRAT